MGFATEIVDDGEWLEGHLHVLVWDNVYDAESVHRPFEPHSTRTLTWWCKMYM